VPHDPQRIGGGIKGETRESKDSRVSF